MTNQISYLFKFDRSSCGEGSKISDPPSSDYTHETNRSSSKKSDKIQKTHQTTTLHPKNSTSHHRHPNEQQKLSAAAVITEAEKNIESQNQI